MVKIKLQHKNQVETIKTTNLWKIMHKIKQDKHIYS